MISIGIAKRIFINPSEICIIYSFTFLLLLWGFQLEILFTLSKKNSHISERSLWYLSISVLKIKTKTTRSMRTRNIFRAIHKFELIALSLAEKRADNPKHLLDHYKSQCEQMKTATTTTTNVKHKRMHHRTIHQIVVEIT